VLVAGAGYLGTTVARLLGERGHDVWALRRHVPNDAVVRYVAADLTRQETLAVLPKEIEYVVYTAAAEAHSDEAYAAVYVRGLRNLLHTLEKRGSPVRRVVFTSSTSVYGGTTAEWVDEGSMADAIHSPE
jgi:nucleoside-diphosphate-sugar epimerase